MEYFSSKSNITFLPDDKMLQTILQHVNADLCYKDKNKQKNLHKKHTVDGATKDTIAHAKRVNGSQFTMPIFEANLNFEDCHHQC